jgi:hypothetical protein
MSAKVTNFSRGRVYVDHDADDLALVARCRAGQTAAFESLVERYQRVLFTVALRMLGDRDAASDAAQNAFAKAYLKLDPFDPTRRFFSWIYRILVNECLNARRDQPPHEPLAPDLAAVGTPADLFETAERRNRVQPIGTLGLLALKPLQVTSYRDTWHRHLLQQGRASVSRP